MKMIGLLFERQGSRLKAQDRFVLAFSVKHQARGASGGSA